MDKNLLTEADLAEFEAGLTELTGVERHVLFRLMELHPIEDVLDILDNMTDEDDVPKRHFAAIDPYAQCEITPSGHQNYKVQIDESGRISVKNPTACWIPKLTLQRQIGGTIFTVTGSYEGVGVLDKKLLRTMELRAENMEDSE